MSIVWEMLLDLHYIPRITPIHSPKRDKTGLCMTLYVRQILGEELETLVLVEKALNWARTDIVGETRRILLGEPEQVLDLTGLIKGVMALEEVGLFNMEENVGRATTKIDLGIDLYNMENWD